MKIIYFVSSLVCESGISVVEIVKANALVEKGNEVIICHNDYISPGKTTLRPVSPKVKLIYLGQDDISIVKKTSPKWIKLFFGYRVEIQRIVNVEKPNVIVATAEYSKYVIPFITKPKGVKSIKIRELHNASNEYVHAVKNRWLLPFFKVYHYISRKFQSLCYDKIFLLTKADKINNFRHSNKFDYMNNPLTINTLPPPILTDTMQISAIKKFSSTVMSRSKTVLYVGRLAPCKNLSALLRIWSLAKRDDWKLKIVGIGVEKDKLENLSKDLNLQDSVEFTGWTYNPSAVMYDASIFCLTSFTEGFCLVTLEAMANGLPLVAFDFPYGASDVIEDGKNGLLIPYLDEEAFAQKLSALMSDEDKIKEMSAAAVIKSQQFSVDKITDLWIEKFEELLANS